MNLKEWSEWYNEEKMYTDLEEKYFNSNDRDEKIKLLEKMIPIAEKIYKCNNNSNTNEAIESMKFELKNLKENK